MRILCIVGVVITLIVIFVLAVILTLLISSILGGELKQSTEKQILESDKELIEAMLQEKNQELKELKAGKRIIRDK